MEKGIASVKANAPGAKLKDLMALCLGEDETHAPLILRALRVNHPGRPRAVVPSRTRAKTSAVKVYPVLERENLAEVVEGRHQVLMSRPAVSATYRKDRPARAVQAPTAR